MSRIFTSRAKPVVESTVLDDELEELPDIPLTPREGWTSVIALSVMLANPNAPKDTDGDGVPDAPAAAPAAAPAQGGTAS